MSVFRSAFYWPEHHASAAWWIAALLSAPWWVRRLWSFLRLLPIWGSTVARNQREIKIRVLERLHNNTNLLILYVLRDALSIAFDFSLYLLAMYFGLTFGSGRSPIRMATFLCLALGSSMIGDVRRLQGIVRDLMDYDAAMGRLKAKQ